MTEEHKDPKWPLLPESLGRRFAILLAGAIVAANLIVIFVNQSPFDGNPGIARIIDRVSLIVPLMEAESGIDRNGLRSFARDRFAVITLTDTSVIPESEVDSRVTVAFRKSLEGLGSHPAEVRATIIDYSPIPTLNFPQSRPRKVILSALLASVDEPDGEWINISMNPTAAQSPADHLPVSLLTIASLFTVLSVGLVFISRLTQPLADLASAARLAGQGNHFTRLPETGAQELRETARAFNEMQDRIAQFDAERSRMVAAVAHDLRTPITSLRIRAELLDEEDRAPLIRTLDEMSVMVDGLVSYVRDQREGEAIQSLDLGDIVEYLADDRGARVKSCASIEIDGRPVALTRAIGNLINNANRYAGGAEISLERSGSDVIILVEDDGPGLDADRIESMFEPFVRGETSRNLQTGGSGLGLSIVRDIIRSHGGTITLSNRPHGGLCARIVLPLFGKS